MSAMRRYGSLVACAVLLVATSVTAEPSTSTAQIVPVLIGQWTSSVSVPKVAVAGDDLVIDSSDRILMPVSSRGEVLVFSRSGALLDTWDTSGTGPSRLERPVRIDIGPSGLVYVLDLSVRKVVVFDSDGTFVREWETGWFDDGRVGLGVGVDDTVYIVDYSSGGGLRVFDSSGGRLPDMGGLYFPRDVAVAPDGIVYGMDKLGVKKWSATGELMATWSLPENMETSDDIAVGSDGTVYVEQAYNEGTIAAFSPDGAKLFSWYPQNAERRGVNINGIAMAADDVAVTLSGALVLSYGEDVAPPRVTVSSPRTRGVYPVGASVKARFACSDGKFGAGVRSCRGDVRSGSRLATERAGRFSFQVSAVDRHGNRTTVRTPYDVAYARPDAYISARGVTRGKDIYRAGQSLWETLPAGGSLQFKVVAQNDERFADTLRIAVTPPAAGYAATYLLNGRNISADVQGGGFITRQLRPGGLVEVTAVLTRSATARGAAAHTVEVVVQSLQHRDRSDKVALHTVG